MDGVDVRSAGTEADPGEPMCGQSAAHAGLDPRAHTSSALTADLITEADLVLVADRTHRAAVARLAPSARPRLFTLRQAADLSAALAQGFAAGRLPDGAPALPALAVDRLRWLVTELDASRGLLAGRPEGSEDIVDRHGRAPHTDVFDEVVAAVDAITQAMDAVLDAEGPISVP